MHELTSVDEEPSHADSDSDDVVFVDETHEMPVKEQLKHLGIFMRILDKHGACPPFMRRTFVVTTRHIRAQHLAFILQTRITDWFQN